MGSLGIFWHWGPGTESLARSLPMWGQSALCARVCREGRFDRAMGRWLGEWGRRVVDACWWTIGVWVASLGGGVAVSVGSDLIARLGRSPATGAGGGPATGAGARWIGRGQRRDGGLRLWIPRPVCLLATFIGRAFCRPARRIGWVAQATQDFQYTAILAIQQHDVRDAHDGGFVWCNCTGQRFVKRSLPGDQVLDQLAFRVRLARDPAGRIGHVPGRERPDEQAHAVALDQDQQDNRSCRIGDDAQAGGVRRRGRGRHQFPALLLMYPLVVRQVETDWPAAHKQSSPRSRWFGLSQRCVCGIGGLGRRFWRTDSGFAPQAQDVAQPASPPWRGRQLSPPACPSWGWRQTGVIGRQTGEIEPIRQALITNTQASSSGTQPRGDYGNGAASRKGGLPLKQTSFAPQQIQDQSQGGARAGGTRAPNRQGRLRLCWVLDAIHRLGWGQPMPSRPRWSERDDLSGRRGNWFRNRLCRLWLARRVRLGRSQGRQGQDATRTGAVAQGAGGMMTAGIGAMERVQRVCSPRRIVFHPEGQTAGDAGAANATGLPPAAGEPLRSTGCGGENRRQCDGLLIAQHPSDSGTVGW